MYTYAYGYVQEKYRTSGIFLKSTVRYVRYLLGEKYRTSGIFYEKYPPYMCM